MKKTLMTLLAMAGVASAALGSTSTPTISTGAGYLLAGYDDFNGVTSTLTQGKLTEEAHANSATWSTDSTTGAITLTLSSESALKFRSSKASVVAMVVDTSKLDTDSFTSIFSYYLGSTAQCYGMAWDGANDAFVGTWNSATSAYSGNSGSLSTDNATSTTEPSQAFSLIYGEKYTIVFEGTSAGSDITIQQLGTDTIYKTSLSGLCGTGADKKFTISAGAIDAIDSLYLFNNRSSEWTTSILAEVSAAAIPEPTTATLSLLALCGLAARRRRH